MSAIRPRIATFLLLIGLLALPVAVRAQSPAASPPSESPAASGAGPSALCALGTAACTIGFGTYEALPFQPDFTLTVDDGWSNDLGYSDAGQVSKEAGALVWASGVRADEHVGTPAIADAATLLASLAALPGATVSAPVPTTVGGSPAQAVEVAMGSEGGDGVFFIAEDSFNLGPGEKARFTVLDKGGQVVVFVQEAYAAIDFDAWIAATQPILDSVTRR